MKATVKTPSVVDNVVFPRTEQAGITILSITYAFSQHNSRNSTSRGETLGSFLTKLMVDDELPAISQRVILQLERRCPKLEASDGSGQRGDWVSPHPSLPMSHQVPNGVICVYTLTLISSVESFQNHLSPIIHESQIWKRKESALQRQKFSKHN